MPTICVRNTKIVSVHGTDIEKVTVTNSEDQFQTLSKINTDK